MGLKSEQNFVAGDVSLVLVALKLIIFNFTVAKMFRFNYTI